MALFGVLTDPVLVQRQDVLDAQWNSAKAVFGTCDNVPTPDSAFAEFTTDYNNWKTFYASGTNWSADANNATNGWQATLKTWTDRFAQWGCTGSFSVTPGSTDAFGSDTPDPTGVPGVKDPPPNTTGWLATAGQDVKDLFYNVKNAASSAYSWVQTLTYVGIGILVLIVVGLVYILTRTKFAGYGVEVNK